MPGDTIRAEVYVKYLDPDPNNWTDALENAIIALAGSATATGTYIDGGAQGTASSEYTVSKFTTRDVSEAPQAYLNYIVFDKKMAILDIGYTRVTTAAREDGSTLGSTSEGASTMNY